jgi:meso-butanediol dehydrogenase/(S,S)-butanediol dehydrogenase/diacetyl reductase
MAEEFWCEVSPSNQKKAMNRLQGKIIIVGGATGGIGKPASRKFHEEGATVVLVARNIDKLFALQKELGDDRTLVVQADLSKMQEVKNLFDKVLETYGRIDGVLITAGTWHLLSIDSSLEEAGKQARDDYGPLVLSVYNTGFVAQKFLIKQNHGLILNISSHAAKKPQLLGNLYYGGAKSFGTHFMRSLSAELQAVGSAVRVCDIQPAIVNTPENAKLLDSEEKQMQAVQPEAIAEWIVENFDNPKIPLEKEFESSLIV